MAFSRSILSLLVVLTYAVGLMAQQPITTAGPTSEVPIRKITLPGGGRYFALPVRVGSKELFAGIDTGSSGLRVLAPALGADDFRSMSEKGRLEFQSGTILNGVRAKADVGFGTVHGPVTIQVVQQVTCAPRTPNCAEGHMPLDQLGLMGGGKPNQGAPAILGASIVPFPVQVPFPELGVQRWILDIPNDLGGGKLILNPRQGSLGGFVRFAYVREPGVPKDALRGCLQNDRTQRKICGIILFDTGAAGMSIDSPDPLPKDWPVGTPASLLYQNEQGSTQLIQSFRTGDPAHSTRMHFNQNPQAKRTVIHANASPFFCFDVMYEADREALYLRSRRSGPHDPQARSATP